METTIADLDEGTPGRPLTGPDARLDDFPTLARRVRARIHGWARRLTGDRDEAEDIAQDVLMRLHANVHTIADHGRLIGWLYRVTHNVAHDRRVLARRRAELLEGFAQHPEPVEMGGTHALSSEGLAELVASYRNTLSARQRKVFTMVDLEGRNAAEVSEELGLAAATVRVHLHRARQAIRLRMLTEHPELLEEYTDDL